MLLALGPQSLSGLPPPHPPHKAVVAAGALITGPPALSPSFPLLCPIPHCVSVRQENASAAVAH